MNVDETRTYNPPRAVNGPDTFALELAANGYDAIARDTHVADKPRIAGTVDDATAAYEQVKRVAFFIAAGNRSRSRREQDH